MDDIRHFILDYEHVNSGLALISIEALIVGIIFGTWKNDLGIGVIAFFVLLLLFMIPFLGGVIILAFSSVEAFLIGGLFTNYTSNTVSWIIGIIAFLLFISLHQAAIGINGTVLGYSLIITEILIISGLIYIAYITHNLKWSGWAICALAGLIVFIFIPIIRYIEAIFLTLLISYGFYIITEYSGLSKTFSIVISLLILLALGTIHLFVLQQINWHGLAANRKSRKYAKNNAMIRQEVYKSWPELEKEFYYFHTCVCQNSFEQIFFESDWNRYLDDLYNGKPFVDFNTWFEEKELYKTSKYNRDFALKYAERRGTFKEENSQFNIEEN